MAVGRTLTAEQAAAYIGKVTGAPVGAESVKVAARSGALSAYRDMLHTGGPWRFSQEDLDAYIVSRQRRTPAQP